MKKPLSFILMAIGVFFAWQWFLSRRNPLLYADAKEDAARQKAAQAANNSTMAQTPALALFDAVRMGWESYNAAVTTPQVLSDGTIIRGTAKLDPSQSRPAPKSNVNPLIFGLFSSN